MLRIGEKVPLSRAVNSLIEAEDVVGELGLPLIVRPAYTLGGAGGGIARTKEELLEITERGLRRSRINQVLIEESVLGWAEVEYEVMDVIAPMREMNLTREWEIDYAKEHGIPVEVTKSKPWSVDENIWSRSIEGGRLEDPSFVPPEEIFEWTTSPEKAPDQPRVVDIGFEAGVPVSLDGEKMSGYALVKKMNEIAGENGVGRTDMIEDRVLGLKARENYEHPAATVLLAAHADLEKLVLTRSELKFKKIVDDQWSELAYYGLVDEPLYADLNAFIDKSQERVTGTVKVRLYKGALTILARSSPNALYSEDLVSFDSQTIDQKDSEGFAKYHGFQARMYRKVMDKE